jgi:hypothetical protein
MSAFRKSLRERVRIAPFCPCGQSNKDGKFSPIDDSGKAGKCHSCGVFFAPTDHKPDFTVRKDDLVNEPLRFIDEQIFVRTLDKYPENNLWIWLANKFGEANANDAFAKYFVGTATNNCTVFWYIDTEANIRTGHIRLFNPETGSSKGADKKPLYENWVHRKLKLDGRFKACLYGEHRLPEFDQSTPVVLVEAAKTALIGDMTYPDLIWCATDGATGLTNAKAEKLRGRHIVLLVDADTAGREKSVAHNAEILEMYKCTFEVADLLPEENTGVDFADLMDDGGHVDNERNIRINENGYPADWD